jgi:hypothetical protein
MIIFDAFRRESRKRIPHFPHSGPDPESILTLPIPDLTRNHIRKLSIPDLIRNPGGVEGGLVQGIPAIPPGNNRSLPL